KGEGMMTQQLQTDGPKYSIGPKRDYGKVKLEIGKLGEPRSREQIGRRLLSGVLAGLAYPDRYHNPLTEAERRLANDLLRVLKGLDSKDYDSLCRIVTGHVLTFLNNFSAGETDPVQWVPLDTVHSDEDEKACLTK